MTQNKQTKQEQFTISGKAFWACTNQVNKLSNKFGMDLSIDEETAQSLEEMNIAIKHAEKEGDERGTYVTLKSTFAPTVVDSEVNTTNVDIGNGSQVNVTAHVYEWNFGKKSGIALGIDAVQIIELVEYVQTTKTGLFTKQSGFMTKED